ncbi:MAG: hypothetical protein ABIJ47_11580 [Candidatus Bathyarchaeota archaeon]
MSEQVLSLERLVALIDEKRPTCICGKVLKGSGLDLWGPHDGGYHVEGFEEKQWVYVHCENPKCGYDMALPKIWRELA